MDDQDKIQCLECKGFYSNITFHVKVHDLTAKEYLKKYPNAKVMSEEYLSKQKKQSLDRFHENPDEYIKKSKSRVFGITQNKALQLLLQRDYRSARICLKNKLWKPSIVLYGSIIEAILIERNKNAKDFYDALETSYKNKDITEKEYHKIHIVRNLRNFVHLHKELSEQEEINEYWAKTFADICEAIIMRFRQ